MHSLTTIERHIGCFCLCVACGHKHEAVSEYVQAPLWYVGLESSVIYPEVPRDVVYACSFSTCQAEAGGQVQGHSQFQREF